MRKTIYSTGSYQKNLFLLERPLKKSVSLKNLYMC